ncbi:MAG: bifunctional 4-hydroxy-2-oxoglutarate aldolase/2-dehydro-3-deoxy-phosphogluconate aldolase [Sphingomicrobium sp.]
MTIDDIMQAAPVIPVLVLDNDIDPFTLAETLVGAGLPVLEVTLRTPFALDAIRAMASVPGAIVGAGTVLNSAMLDKALAAGSRFIVSPGLTENLGRAAIASGMPFLPGVASAGDIMRGLDLGLDRFKFFPAEAAGGLKALNSLAGPFDAVRFCPTGGITLDNAPTWLAHPSVRCIGGSWICKAGDTDITAIEKRARAAAHIRN